MRVPRITRALCVTLCGRVSFSRPKAGVKVLVLSGHRRLKLGARQCIRAEFKQRIGILHTIEE